ncbi:hypothetical protein [uncultured Tenacibaculum sp.]|uniref:hypothetical protein n=1 Tax=uncultured Tenacibaculum sp. TaxID=174713 RepID=UPI00262F361D|nr:hypothetical protein [uncultured Tenacibaculum sp.]
MIITKNNFKSPHIFIFYILFFVLGVGLLIQYYFKNNIDALYIAMGVFLFLGVLFIIGFMTKIRIERKGITQNSVLKDKLLHWNDIKTIGVCRVNKYGVKIVAPENYDTFSFLGQKFIFVSTEQNYTPKQIQNSSSDSIYFHWRKEAWTEIEKYYQPK